MNWKTRSRVVSYLRSSLWVVPIAALILEQICARFVDRLDERIQWEGLALGVEGARALCNAVVTVGLSFTVFTFGSLLVAIQVASGQYTPRIIATTLLRDNVIRYTVGLFIFSFLFAIKVLNHIEASVPQIAVFIAGLLGLICIAAFLFLIEYAARLLRPVSLVARVGEAGLAVLDHDYPEKLSDGAEPPGREPNVGPVQRTLLQRGTSAVLVAVNVPQLIAAADKTDGVIELAPQVGDFVGVDEPLFLLHGPAAQIDDTVLESCLIFGSERTMEQDPLFAFRILVDIGIKALSAAINDPTTAVLAIDQLHRLLRRAGVRNLRTDFLSNRAGDVRVILRTPNWRDFVHLAFTEIRFCGAGNVQIARRLRAMLLNLASTLPPRRGPALQQELELLDRMLEKLYVLPEDLALARVPDTQGLGGSAAADAMRVGGPALA